MNFTTSKLGFSTLGARSGFRVRNAVIVVLGLTWVLLATPQARVWLEGTMSGHMLVQIPLLVAIGFLAVRTVPVHRQEALLALVGGAIPCVLLALITLSYWMLPRALDAALIHPLAELIKFVSLPVLIGVPLALAWRRLTMIGRGVVLTNFISMLAVLGWLYIAAPVRVCNNYAVFEQERAGWLMVQLAVLLLVAWFSTLFVGGSTHAPEAVNRDDPANFTDSLCVSRQGSRQA